MGRERDQKAFERAEAPQGAAAFSATESSIRTAPVDRLDRPIDYLRLSITDRCNERCLYCLPEGLAALRDREELLSFEEILRVVRVAVALGFGVFRVTGGEPLVRRGAADLLSMLAAEPGVASLGLSTNATLLAPCANRLRRAGVQSVNISLDTLEAGVYHRLTGGELAQCLEGIDSALNAGFPSLKLNAVLLRGINQDQVVPLARFAGERRIPVRFIEWMPLSGGGMEGSFLPVGEAKTMLQAAMALEPVEERIGHGPARYYRSSEGSLIGFIGAMSEVDFCSTCNKLRLTADGKLRPCLGDALEVDLRDCLRADSGDGCLEERFRQALRLKPKSHAFTAANCAGRPMCSIGG